MVGRAKGREKRLQRIYCIRCVHIRRAHAFRASRRLRKLTLHIHTLNANRFHGPNSCRNTLNLTLP